MADISGTMGTGNANFNAICNTFEKYRYYGRSAREIDRQPINPYTYDKATVFAVAFCITFPLLNLC